VESPVDPSRTGGLGSLLIYYVTKDGGDILTETKLAKIHEIEKYIQEMPGFSSLIRKFTLHRV
jgi:hypothetical protein